MSIAELAAALPAPATPARAPDSPARWAARTKSLEGQRQDLHARLAASESANVALANALRACEAELDRFRGGAGGSR